MAGVGGMILSPGEKNEFQYTWGLGSNYQQQVWASGSMERIGSCNRKENFESNGL